MTNRKNAELLEEYLNLVCEDQEPLRRGGYRDWLVRRMTAPLAVGALVTLGCSGSSFEASDDEANGGEAGTATSVGGDSQGVAGDSTGIGGAARGGSGQGGAQQGGSGQGGSGRGGAQQGGSGQGGSGQGGSGQGGSEQGGSGQGGSEQGGSAQGGAQQGGSGQGGNGQGGAAGNGAAGILNIGGGALYGIFIETSCGDRIDNDQDGDIDCADSDCLVVSSCMPDYAAPVERCDDDQDNDYDELVDCQDPDCAEDPGCKGGGGAGGVGNEGGAAAGGAGDEGGVGAGGAGNESGAGGGGGAEEGVYATLSVDDISQPGIQCLAGALATATLHNQTQDPLYLSGCEDNQYSINGSAPNPDPGCVGEGSALAVESGGTFEVSYRCPDQSSTVTICFNVNYGCTPDMPLSQANCTSDETVCAPSFNLVPLP